MNTKKRYWNPSVKLRHVSPPISSRKLQRKSSKVGLSLVKKSIKLADRSEFGWKTAIEYEQDDLASDSEDEKRIHKSERVAERKLKIKRGKFGLNGPTESFSTCLQRKEYIESGVVVWSSSWFTF